MCLFTPTVYTPGGAASIDADEFPVQYKLIKIF